MKKIFILILSLFLAGGVFYFWLEKHSPEFPYEDITLGEKVQMPIDSSREAAMYIKNFNDFHDQVIKASQDIGDIDIEWTVTTSHTETEGGTIWNSQILSNGVIPQFKCSLSVSSQGEIISNDGCEWFK
jgi:hypothetical protein